MHAAPTMRKPSTTTTRKQGAGKEMILKRPQRGLGVAELERIRLQEEQEQLLLYHHKKQQQQESLHHKHLPFLSNHHDLPLFHPTFINPNPSFINLNPNSIHTLATSNAESPIYNPPFIAIPHAKQAAPTKPSLSPSLHANPNLNPALVANPKCSELWKKSSHEFMLSNSSVEARPPACPSLVPSLATKPGFMSTYNEHSEFLLPYAITAQNSPFSSPSFTAANLTAASPDISPIRNTNPNITPIHNTSPNLKITRNAQNPPVTSPVNLIAANPNIAPIHNTNPNIAPIHNTNPNLKINSASTLHSIPNATPSLNTLVEHSFFPQLHPSTFEVANDITQPYHAASPNVENTSSLIDSFLNPPHEHNCKAPKKNIPALHDAEELELPSFQSMVFKKQQQQSISCGYEKQYMRCNLDLNNTQGEYELAYDAKINPRTKIISSRDTSIFGVDTSPRDDFLKLGLPTITNEEWNKDSMQTKMLEHFHEHTINPRMDLHYHALYGKMVKENKPYIDLELKLSLPCFGYQ